MSVLYAFYSNESPELSNFSMFNITAATTLTERVVLPEIRFSYKAMRRNCQMQECPKFMFYSNDNTYSYFNGIDDVSNMIFCDNE